MALVRCKCLRNKALSKAERAACHRCGGMGKVFKVREGGSDGLRPQVTRAVDRAMAAATRWRLATLTVNNGLWQGMVPSGSTLTISNAQVLRNWVPPTWRDIRTTTVHVPAEGETIDIMEDNG